MPPRRDLTLEAYQQREARQREQSRLRSLRYRARHRDDHVRHGDAPSLHARTNGSADARSTAFLVTSVPSEQNESSTDFEQVRCVLAPLRGYAHDERLLERLAATCPAVDLVLEAIGMAEWLNRPANRKRVCNTAFIRNWVQQATTRPAGRVEPQRAAHAAHEPRSALGRVLEQIATSPVEGPSTWGPH